MVERGAGAMNLPGEFSITDAPFIHFLLDEFANVDVFEFGFHCWVPRTACTCSPVITGDFPFNKKA